MKIQKSPVTVYNISFTDEEFLVINDGFLNYCYFTGYLWTVKELDNLLEDISTNYKKKGIEVKLSQDLPDILYSVIQEFLTKAEVE
jgi:hypothetical protein